jgi:phage terminase large subunit-like protein
MAKKAIHPTTQYAIDVVYGNITACVWEIAACKRHLEDLERSKADKSWPYVFDETRADRIFDFFKLCRHVRGPFSGEPIELDLWQKFDLGCTFGWVDRQSGRRRFKTAYIRIGRGNTKSTMMSGVANYGMCADAMYPPGRPDLAKYEAAPEVVCGAVDKEQANIVWGEAREMGIKSAEISKRLELGKTHVRHKQRGGQLKKLSKDTKNKDGGAPCIIIIDEYHAHPTSLVKDVTSSGKGKRAQCLEFIITTAGEDAENKPCKVEDDIVKKILQGIIKDDRYFGVIREIDDDDNPHDEKCWIKANPIFHNQNDYSRELYETIKSEHDLAFGSGDNSKIRQWMIKRVNRWQADSENKYFSGCMDKWKSLAVSRDEFAELVRGRACYFGLDLSKCVDLTADAFVFVLDDGRFAVCAHGFVPDETADRHEKSDRVPYKDWAKDGWCTLTEGAVTDDNSIKGHIHDKEIDEKWSIVEICYDPYSARQFSNDMTAEGYVCVEIRQGIQTLFEPTKKFRELVLQGKVVHDGSPILTWCLSNAVETKPDTNGNFKLSKRNVKDTQRIDLAAAVINAMARALAAVEGCVYNTRPVGDKIFAV